MSDRITGAQVHALAAAVTRLLPEGVAVSAERRNGSVSIDRLRRHGQRWATVSTLTTGTTRDAYQYLYAMREGIWLSREEV